MKASSALFAPRNWTKIILFLTVFVPGIATASHTNLTDDFDTSVGNWNGILMPNSPFGGSYISPYIFDTTVTTFVLDATYPGSGGTKNVYLTFDVVNFDPSNEAFQVSVTSQPIDVTGVFDLLPSDSYAGTGSARSFALHFSLTSIPPSCCHQDLSVRFEKLSPGNWGLDNIVLDWSGLPPSSWPSPVPLPATLWLFMCSCGGFAILKRRLKTLKLLAIE